MNKDISTLAEPAYVIRGTDISPLVRVLNYFHPLNADIIKYFQKNTFSCHFKKGGLLLKAGNVCQHLYFINSGVVRGFINENGKDITTWITAENEMVTSISGLDLGIPAFENIEAIEDCQLLAMTNTAMEELYLLHPEFNITGRKLLQQYYRDAESRAYIVRLTNAEQKYNYFLEKYNHLANRIALKYIASYLGITVETLSRVRKKLSLPGS